MSADVPLPPLGSIGPWEAGAGGAKNSKKWGVVSFVQWTATISVFSQHFQMWCRTVQIGQGDSTGWAKKFEKISNFSPFRDFTSIYL